MVFDFVEVESVGVVVRLIVSVVKLCLGSDVLGCWVVVVVVVVVVEDDVVVLCGRGFPLL